MRNGKLLIVAVLLVLFLGVGPSLAADAAKKAARLTSKSPAAAPYQITIDYTDAPELKDWVEKKLQPTADTWYAKIVKTLPSKDFTPPARVDRHHRWLSRRGGHRREPRRV